MEKIVSLTDAKRQFSSLLRHVSSGQRYVIARYGKSIARIDPLRGRPVGAVVARKRLLERLRKQRCGKIGSWKREDLYK